MCDRIDIIQERASEEDLLVSRPTCPDCGTVGGFL